VDPIERLTALRAIEDVVGRYCILFDDQDWDALEGLWTDDAAFVVDGEAFEGRPAVLDFLRTCLPAGYRSKHLISPPVIDLAADDRTARARTDVAWIAQNFEVAIVARYDDAFACGDDGVWRIRRRDEHAVPFQPGPPPMSGDAVRVSGATMRRA
jgi:ketosteroid isomerase-like protein